MQKPLLDNNDDEVKIRKQPTIYTYIIPLLFTFAFLLYQGVRLAKRIEINITIHKDREYDGAPSLLRQTPIANYKIPTCAQDVFISLHSKAYSSIRDEDECRGMLIRDDIILTTAECSKRNYTFDWHADTPQIILEAYPHDELNNKVNIENSPLGFLKVDAPPHYYYINRTAPRNRMFLSVQSKGRNGAKTIAMRCKDDKPIAHNFPTPDGNMIPLRQLIDILLPDDILWEHRDIDTAPTLTYKNEVWWSKAITLEDEEEIIKQLIEEHTGPIGSVSIPYAHSWERWTKQAMGIMEAVDPRGHRLGGSSVSGGCMHDYYKLYIKQEPFSGAHYFDWFDFGEGNTILQDDEKCNKETFNSHKVHYFTDEQRAFHKVYMSKSEDGKKTILRYENNDELVPASEGEGASSGHLYMWDLDENFYVVDSRWNEEKFGVAKHTGLMAGQPALSAGEVYMNENGELWGIK